MSTPNDRFETLLMILSEFLSEDYWEDYVGRKVFSHTLFGSRYSIRILNHGLSDKIVQDVIMINKPHGLPIG